MFPARHRGSEETHRITGSYSAAWLGQLRVASSFIAEPLSIRRQGPECGGGCLKRNMRSEIRRSRFHRAPDEGKLAVSLLATIRPSRPTMLEGFGARGTGVPSLLKRWRLRNRQRAELAALADQGFDFGDLGITQALAMSEADKWPWQQWGMAWGPASVLRAGERKHRSYSAARRGPAMARAYYSIVLDHTAEDTWAIIRPFDHYAWAGVSSTTVIEKGKAGDQVGAVRRVDTGAAVIRQLLLSHSDLDRSYTYALCDPPPFPVRNYTATIRVTPIVESNKAFVEWWATFDCADHERDRWTTYFQRDGFAKWLGALRLFMETSAPERAGGEGL